jgi:hypothetical protein
MTFSLHDIGAAASDKIEKEIALRKSEGKRKLLRHEAERIALIAAGEAFVVDRDNIETLFFYVPQILDQKASSTETVRQSIHRIVVHEAMKNWQSTIDWNVAKQHQPYDIDEVVEVVPAALKYLRRLGRHPEVEIKDSWIGLALLFFSEQTPEKLLELEEDNVKEVCRSLGRQLDGIAWSIQDAAPRKAQKATEYHNKLLELMDMLYMIGHGQIDTSDVSWPRQTS